MFKCPSCGSLMETDNENDADYVVLGHVVCGRVCYDALSEEGRKWNERYQLPLRLDPG